MTPYRVYKSGNNLIHIFLFKDSKEFVNSTLRLSVSEELRIRGLKKIPSAKTLNLWSEVFAPAPFETHTYALYITSESTQLFFNTQTNLNGKEKKLKSYFDAFSDVKKKHLIVLNEEAYKVYSNNHITTESLIQHELAHFHCRNKQNLNTLSRITKENISTKVLQQIRGELVGTYFHEQLNEEVIANIFSPVTPELRQIIASIDEESVNKVKNIITRRFKEIEIETIQNR